MNTSTRFKQLLLLVFVAVMSMGQASCDAKPDAIRCITIEEKGFMYLRCRNSAKEKSFNLGMEAIGKCLNKLDEKCQWILTDITEYEKFKKHYEGQCKK